MSHHSEHVAAKRLKKQAQLAHNKHIQTLQDMNASLEQSRDLEKEREEALRKAELKSSRSAVAGKKGEPIWSAKLQEIRDRNTGRSHMAKERWNRFAGTEAGGGRGL